MKRIIYLSLGIILLVILGIVAKNLTAKSGESDTDVAAFNFDVKDTASINKIIVTEPTGDEIELIRSNGKWTDKDGGCVQQAPVNNMLEGIYNIRFKGYVPDNSIENVTKRMATIGIKVQIFQNGEWSKTWYIGTSTPDHFGTYMLVESEEAGKSDLPVIMEIKGLQGIIGPRYFADPRRWGCTEVFALAVKDIQGVDVNFTERKERSFSVQRQGKSHNYKVLVAGKQLPFLDTNMISHYLLNFQKIHYEYDNFELSDKQVDSLVHTRPFCIMTVKTTNGASTKLRMFYRKSEKAAPEVDEFGEMVSHDINRFWCLLPNGKLVKCQYFNFGPLIMGNIYFKYRTA